MITVAKFGLLVLLGPIIFLLYLTNPSTADGLFGIQEAWLVYFVAIVGTSLWAAAGMIILRRK